MRKIHSSLFSQENLLAVLLCLILSLLAIFTADSPPTWIYQGFSMNVTQIFVLNLFAISISLVL